MAKRPISLGIAGLQANQLTLDYCVKVSDGSALHAPGTLLSAVGGTLQELGTVIAGDYLIGLAVTEDTAFGVYVTASPEFWDSDVFSLVDGDEAKETTVSARPTLAEMLLGGLGLEETIALVAAYVDELETRLTAGRAALLDKLGTGVTVSPAQIAEGMLQEYITEYSGERLRVRRGAKKKFVFTFNEGFPLTGAESVFFTAKKDPLTADAQASINKACAITDAPARKCEVELTALEMNIDPGLYKVEVTVFDAGDLTGATARKPIAGELEVEQNVRLGV